MSLQKDIHQLRNFRNEYQKAIINLIFTNNWLSEKIKEYLDKEDITPQQFNILRILRGSFPEPLSTLQIRERMLDKMSDTSRIVDRLVVKDLVKKSSCKTDKRLVDVLITDKGKKLLDKLDAKSNEMDGILSHLSETEAKTLNKLLDKTRGSSK
ncbi:MAG: MarR family winged helix-turn-helix transcriptional regulator [Sphingobacteriales bacterium]